MPKDRYNFTGDKPAIRRDDAPGNEPLANQGRVWAVGMNFAFTIMGGGVLGWLIQRFLMKNAAPWPLVIGLGCGMLVGLVQFMREAMRLNKG